MCQKIEKPVRSGVSQASGLSILCQKNEKNSQIRCLTSIWSIYFVSVTWKTRAHIHDEHIPHPHPSLLVLKRQLWCCRCRQGQLRRKRTFVRTDAVSCTIEDHELFQKMLIHISRHIIINTEGKEVTRKSRMGRRPWVTNICSGFEPELLSGSVQSVSSF